MPTSYTRLKKLSDKKGEVEFQAEITPETLTEHESALLAEIAADFERPGFRKGQVPEHIVRENVDGMHLLEDAAYRALRSVIADIVNDEKVELLGSPAVHITKLAPGNPVTFTVRIARSPSVSLPDYRKIGKTVVGDEKPAEISDEELQKGIDQIRRIAAARMEAPEGAPLPELTAEFVKQLGPFETIEAFKEELRKQLAEEQKAQSKQGRRDKILAEIVKKTKVAVPTMTIEDELGSFKEQRDEELKRMGVALEDYLKQRNKTLEAFEAEEREFAENQVKARLVLREIIKKEKLEADEHEAEHMLIELRKRYGKQDEAELRRTAAALALQEKLFRFLEGEETI